MIAFVFDVILLFDLRHIDVVGPWIDVDEHDLRTDHLDRFRRRNESVRDGDHFVARANTERP